MRHFQAAHIRLTTVSSGRCISRKYIHHRRRIQMIHRDVEETLDLLRVQIHRQHAVRPRCDEQVGDELGRDRHPRLVLAVLAA